MAVSQNALEKILSGARTLCSPEGDRMVNSYKASGQMNFDDPDPNSFNDFKDPYLNDEEDNEGLQASYLSQQAPAISESKMRTSGMDKNILESFRNQQIDVTGLSNISVLDQMSAESKKRIAGTMKVEKREPIREQRTNNSNMGFDYTALKAVMKECIEEYFSTHPLNESTLKQISLKEGKINLVDNKGNVYGADLVFKKNINEGKR